MDSNSFKEEPEVELPVEPEVSPVVPETPVAPEAPVISETPVVPVNPVAPEKKSHKLVILVVIFGILAVLGGGFGAYTYMQLGKKNNEITGLRYENSKLKESIKNLKVADVPEEKPENKPEEKPEDLPDDTLMYRDTEVRSLVAELRTLTENALHRIADDYDNVYIQVASTIFGELKSKTTLDKGYGFRVYDDTMTITEISDIYDTISYRLKTDGFRVFKEAASFPDNPPFINDSNGITCSVGNGSPFVVSCGYYKWLKEETVLLVNELAEAYKAKRGEYPNFLGVYGPDYQIGNSAVYPYQNLTAHFENSGAFFYRVSPESKWQFFDDGRATNDCSDYNTDDLRKAFANWPCIDVEGGDTTVQPW